MQKPTKHIVAIMQGFVEGFMEEVMNRIVIKVDENGNIDKVSCDTEVRVFVFDPYCKNEPLYEFSEGLGKFTGVRHVREMIGDNLAATYESTGPWLNSSPNIEKIK